MAKSLLSRVARAAIVLPQRVQTESHNRRIRQILASNDSGPSTARSESQFDSLQQWPKRAEYGYDSYSTWSRGVHRAIRLLQLDPTLSTPGCSILDVGTGDGLLGVALHSYGHHVTLTDLEDWRDPRAHALPFMQADCCIHLPFPDNTFDLTCSYNSFEHLPNPAGAIQQILRVTRPGGLIHLEFGPLYSGPWGLHAYRMLTMPYPQYLFSEEFIDQKLAELGIWDLGKKRAELQFVNQWKVDEFDALWSSSGCTLLNRRVGTNRNGLPLVFRFPEAFRGRNLSLEDLTADHMIVTLQKP